jgi:hypothetical protein
MKDPHRSGPGTALLAAAVIWSGFLFFHYFSFPLALDLYFFRVFYQDALVFQADKFFGTWIWFLKNLLGVLLLGLVFSRMGTRITRWAGLGLASGLMGRLLEIALGALGLGLFWTALGFNGLWFEGPFKLILVALALWALIDMRGRIDEEALPTWWKAQSPGTKGWVAFGGLFGMLGLGMAAAPDVFYDGLVYHLSTLQAWLDRHGIVDLPANLYTYYPFGGETILFNGYLLGGSEGAKLLNAAGLVMTGMAAGAWVAEVSGIRAGVMTWAMVMSIPVLNASVWTTQVDALLALFCLLFLFSLERGLEGKGKGWALAAGIFAGAALSVKYTAGIGLLLAVVIFWIGKPRKRLDRGWARMAAFAVVVAAILAGPWFLRNLVFQADPLYPYPFLGKGGLSGGNFAGLMDDHQATWIRHPAFLDWLEQAVTQDLDKTIAPLLFGLLPLIFFWERWPARARVLGILGCLWLVAGLVLSHQIRLLVPIFPVLLTAVGMGLGSLSTPGWRRWAAGIVLIFGLLSFLSMGRTALRFYQIDKVWMGLWNQREYLTQNLQSSSYFPLAQAAAQVIPPDKRLLIVGDARSLYYSNPVVANSAFDAQLLFGIARTEKDADGIRKRLRENGIDHIVVSGTEGLRITHQNSFMELDPESSQRLGAFLDKWTSLLFRDGDSGIYRLEAVPNGAGKKTQDLFEMFQHTFYAPI